MEKSTKPASNSLTLMSEIILPNDANNMGNLMGGKLMYWMDIAGAIAAQKHCNTQVVTASVDNISFTRPIRVGDLLTIESIVTRSFHTSMEVFIRVWGENLKMENKYLSNEAYLTFVSLGSEGKPQPVPEIIVESAEETERYAGALRRRQLRLVLAGKMKPGEASELKALFE